ncbi:response regulator [Paenarthrobacter sp. DKR-5]|uniref:sensor histidine kinase n=1 Tax=Paenarthrobacter sp. DKR-5 TaxID=2835535 RepID=UPI001BDCA8CB|nr:ATP-binding protein [Paenarthrobacter sp. DKR-5]MBT1003245.1 response regulator [Paenarthrobacter sp. DKR-5]
MQLPADSRPARPALVVVSDAGTRASALEALSSLGLDAAAADTEAVLGRPADLLLVDAGFDGGRGVELVRILRRQKSAATVVLLGDDAELPEASECLELGIADYVYKPVRAQELAHRVEHALEAVQRQREHRETMEALREQTRAVSASIRSTNDPQAMASSVTRGLGQAFEADLVVLWVFEDHRVSVLTQQWRRPGAHAGVPVEGLERLTDSARDIAEGLWEGSSVLSAHGNGLAEALRPWPAFGTLAEEAGATAVAGVPVGEGESVFGLVWFVSTGSPRAWSGTELSLIQHVANNLAYGLIQGNLITVQQQVLKRLQQLDKAKSDFVATVNHELRTPLTSITGYLDMVLSGEGGDIPPVAARMLEIVGRNSARLQGLIEDVLTLSRMDSQQQLPRMEAVDVGTVLKTVVTSLSPIAAAADVELTLDTSGAGPLTVEGNEAQLEQVFTNIASNAIKFTPAGGTVHVATSKEKSETGRPHATVRVLDTGIGVPAEDVPRLFTRFFRASNATAAAIPGTGLGLAIVHEVVQQHGGELAVSSIEGQGTTMTVRLPEFAG